MFEPLDTPRLFALPPGADFPALLVEGLRTRLTGAPPDRLARTTIYVNTERMRRRIVELFDQGPPGFLPRLRMVTEIGRDPTLADLPLPVSPLRRRLELAQLVARLIEADPGLAPRAALFDLADSLAALMDEMQGEGVPLSAIEALDTGTASAHWERSRSFLALVGRYLAAGGTEAPDPEARQRMAVERLAARWRADPPADPVIVAGSTGSRGATLLLMEAVARLPQGAVILPGFDTDLPGAIWAELAEEDHPQYRFLRLMGQLGLGPGEIRTWSDLPAPAPARNRLVSLALRPAPVTDGWRRDGPALGDMGEATRAMTFVEAPDPRAEARAIAWVLRQAAEAGRCAALVTPDRMLTRRVAALLDRWDIAPDDSAGRPFALSPPGRLLRQAAALLAGRCALHEALALLKHPLTHAGTGRGPHLRHAREFELWLRDKALPWIGADTLARWARDKPERAAWAEWFGGILAGAELVGTQRLEELATRHLELARRLVAGAGSEDDGPLWDRPAGRKAAEIVVSLRREAGHGGTMSAADYVTLFQGIIAREEVRDRDEPRPDIMIWGTMEARVQGAELVVLGGLNDGTWPGLPAPDPWLNRRMRAEAGLLLPERRIGLAAHDFQQAIAAPEVVLTRTIRDESALPVPSRWLNRLTNLLAGLTATGGPEALAAMRARGQALLAEADALDRPAADLAPEPRPSPRPPVTARPRRLSFTQVETLCRDPYEIYARHILGLRAVRPLRPEPDALLRGIVTHAIFARFVSDWRDGVADPRAHLLAIAGEEIAKHVAWPMAARLWLARIERIADRFLAEETKWRESAELVRAEVDGRLTFDRIGFTLAGRADRIDRLRDGSLAVLDYKTGSVPSGKEIRAFRVQLLLEALIAEEGGFDGIAPAPVDQVVHIGLGSNPKRSPQPLAGDFATPVTRRRFESLIASYASRAKGYTARRTAQNTGFEGDYDHLSRYGEWDETAEPVAGDVG